MRRLSMHDALEEQARCEHCKGWLYNAEGGIHEPITGNVCNHCLKVWPVTVTVRGQPVLVFEDHIER